MYAKIFDLNVKFRAFELKMLRNLSYRFLVDLVEPFYGLDCTTEEKISATKMLAVSVIGKELLEYFTSFVKLK